MNPLPAYLALAGAIACEVVGSSLLQRSEQFTRWVEAMGAVACFAASLYLLSLALKVVPLAAAYAIWAGLGIVLTALVGIVFLRQALDLAAIAGILLIVAGVVTMQAFSATTGH